ncbi:MAG: uroporphyrinogen decarboxylase [Bdellovibrionales bacterium]|nr:uroporphyrinogen decarboxylase [Bdellovibrionales bacterium]
MNERFHNALKGIPQATPPVWFMRQAGRYHKHYQALRKKHGFMELCKQPELAAEVALGPLQDFDFDVAILFSDLLFPLEAMGMGLTYDPAPQLAWRLNSTSIRDLKPWKEALPALAFQKDALMATRHVIPKNKSLIGFVGGPWTLFTYAAEGEHKGNLIGAKTNMVLFHRFCETLMPLLEANIQLQLEGGAEIVMLFDTAAGELSPMMFKQDVQKYMLRLADKFPGRLGYYSKGTTPYHLTDIRQNTSFAGFGVDHRFDLPAELKGQARGFLQGNFDQSLLFCAPEEFQARLVDYLKPFQLLTPEQRRGWVCGLGHGVLPATPEDNVRHFVRYVREVFK